MSFEIKDLAGLSQPLTKLVEVVSSAVGAGFRPSAIRKEADARSYEIRALAQAAAEATEIQNDVRLQAHAKRIALIAAENPELATRAKQRLLIREVEGQLNIETIANHAALALPSQVSEEPIAADWRRKFFLEAENVCEADLQFLWGKVLAGEIVQPGSFGLRTLESLRNLSREDAELFRRACAVAMSDGWIALRGMT